MTDKDLDEIIKSFAIVMKMLAEQRLDLEVCRVMLRSKGVEDADFEVVKVELKRRWDSQSDELIQQIKTKRTAEQMRQLLESAEGTKQ